MVPCRALFHNDHTGGADLGARGCAELCDVLYACEDWEAKSLGGGSVVPLTTKEAVNALPRRTLLLTHLVGVVGDDLDLLGNVLAEAGDALHSVPHGHRVCGTAHHPGEEDQHLRGESRQRRRGERGG